MNDKKKCFVIMPFTKTKSRTKEEWTEIFENTIKPSVEDCGFDYECGRYKLRRANIIKDILQELNSAHVVIADLTDSNPNVLWELGVRHTLSKRTILIAQNKKALPSDLKDYPVITYKYKQTPTEFNRFRQDIKEKLKDIEADPANPDNPVADFLKDKNRYLLDYDKATNLKKLSALISELSYNIHSVDDILSEIEKSEQVRKKDPRKFRISLVRFSNSCLELLLSTSYLVLPKELLHTLKDINHEMRNINGNLGMWGQQIFTEAVEKQLKGVLPRTKQKLTSLLGEISKLRLDYINDNYQEPAEPNIILSSPEHGKYLEIEK